MISIITPTNNSEYLGELYDSLKNQTFEDWEWILVPNGSVTIPDFKDERVKIFPSEPGTEGVGALKYFACKHANGEIIVEVDHDDILTHDALESVNGAFREYPDCCFVYSNCAYVDRNLNPVENSKEIRFSYSDHKTRDFLYNGVRLTQIVTCEPLPQILSRLAYAPDHLRAWRAKDYWKIGGHDVNLKVADDHDLIIRFYLYGKMIHIDKCLYLYRIHDANTWVKNPQRVLDAVWNNYEKYIYQMAEKWADDNKLIKAAIIADYKDMLDGYKIIDLVKGDISPSSNKRLPFKDNSVGIIFSNETIQYFKDPVHIMNEAFRCLCHGGFLMINVPSTDGRAAFQNPSYLSYWNENSFSYYIWENSPGLIKKRLKCWYQPLRLRTFNPRGENDPLKKLYVEAHLIAIKDPKRPFPGKFLF